MAFRRRNGVGRVLPREAEQWRERGTDGGTARWRHADELPAVRSGGDFGGFEPFSFGLEWNACDAIGLEHQGWANHYGISFHAWMGGESNSLFRGPILAAV